MPKQAAPAALPEPGALVLVRLYDAEWPAQVCDVKALRCLRAKLPNEKQVAVRFLGYDNPYHFLGYYGAKALSQVAAAGDLRGKGTGGRTQVARDEAFKQARAMLTLGLGKHPLPRIAARDAVVPAKNAARQAIMTKKKQKPTLALTPAPTSTLRPVPARAPARSGTEVEPATGVVASSGTAGAGREHGAGAGRRDNAAGVPTDARAVQSTRSRRGEAPAAALEPEKQHPTKRRRTERHVDPDDQSAAPPLPSAHERRSARASSPAPKLHETTRRASGGGSGGGSGGSGSGSGGDRDRIGRFVEKIQETQKCTKAGHSIAAHDGGAGAGDMSERTKQQHKKKTGPRKVANGVAAGELLTSSGAVALAAVVKPAHETVGVDADVGAAVAARVDADAGADAPSESTARPPRGGETLVGMQTEAAAAIGTIDGTAEAAWKAAAAAPPPSSGMLRALTGLLKDRVAKDVVRGEEGEGVGEVERAEAEVEAEIRLVISPSSGEEGVEQGGEEEGGHLQGYSTSKQAEKDARDAPRARNTRSSGAGLAEGERGEWGKEEGGYTWGHSMGKQSGRDVSQTRPARHTRSMGYSLWGTSIQGAPPPRSPRETKKEAVVVVAATLTAPAAATLIAPVAATLLLPVDATLTAPAAAAAAAAPTTAAAVVTTFPAISTAAPARGLETLEQRAVREKASKAKHQKQWREKRKARLLEEARIGRPAAGGQQPEKARTAIVPLLAVFPPALFTEKTRVTRHMVETTQPKPVPVLKQSKSEHPKPEHPKPKPLPALEDKVTAKKTSQALSAAREERVRGGGDTSTNTPPAAVGVGAGAAGEKMRGNSRPRRCVAWAAGTAPRVTVVGAGPAGLCAARLLHLYGVETVVLEARDRVGGRILSETLPARPEHNLPASTVDLGASFVHGCNPYNPLFVMAAERGETLDNAEGGYSAGWGAECAWYDARLGGAVSRRAVQRAFKVVWTVNEKLGDVAIPDSAEGATEAVARERGEAAAVVAAAAALALGKAVKAGGACGGAVGVRGSSSSERARDPVGAAAAMSDEWAPGAAPMPACPAEERLETFALPSADDASSLFPDAIAADALALVTAATALAADAAATTVDDESRWRACGEWGALDVQRQGCVEWGAGAIEDQRVALLTAVAGVRRDLSLAAACALVLPEIVKRRKMSGVEMAVMESAKVVMWGFNAPLRCMSARVQQAFKKDIEEAKEELNPVTAKERLESSRKVSKKSDALQTRHWVEEGPEKKKARLMQPQTPSPTPSGAGGADQGQGPCWASGSRETAAGEGVEEMINATKSTRSASTRAGNSSRNGEGSGAGTSAGAATATGNRDSDGDVPSEEDEDDQPVDLSDGLVVGGYHNLVIARAAEGLPVRTGERVVSISVSVHDNEPSPSLNLFPPPPSTALAAAAGAAPVSSSIHANDTCGSGVTDAAAAGAGAPGAGAAAPRCRVTTQSGETIHSNFVVVALPLGVLQSRSEKSSVTFSPALSEPKRRAIAAIGMGTENKVIMRFQRCFWPEKTRFLQCTDQRFRFLNLHPYGKPNTIVAHVAPPFGEGFSGWTDAEVVAEVCGVLRRMFKIAPAADLPELLDSFVTRWGEDPFSCGAYSFMRVGSDLEDVAALAAPEHGGLVHFAGEACSIEGAQCVHGALLTGQAAASEILRSLGVSVRPEDLLGGEVGLSNEIPTDEWVQCGRGECQRWRRIPAHISPESLDHEWECSMCTWHTALQADGCSAPQEPWDELPGWESAAASVTVDWNAWTAAKEGFSAAARREEKARSAEQLEREQRKRQREQLRERRLEQQQVSLALRRVREDELGQAQSQREQHCRGGGGTHGNSIYPNSQQLQGWGTERGWEQQQQWQTPPGDANTAVAATTVVVRACQTLDAPTDSPTPTWLPHGDDKATACSAAPTPTLTWRPGEPSTAPWQHPEPPELTWQHPDSSQVMWHPPDASTMLWKPPVPSTMAWHPPDAQMTTWQPPGPFDAAADPGAAADLARFGPWILGAMSGLSTVPLPIHPMVPFAGSKMLPSPRLNADNTGASATTAFADFGNGFMATPPYGFMPPPRHPGIQSEAVMAQASRERCSTLGTAARGVAPTPPVLAAPDAAHAPAPHTLQAPAFFWGLQNYGGAAGCHAPLALAPAPPAFLWGLHGSAETPTSPPTAPVDSTWLSG